MEWQQVYNYWYYSGAYLTASVGVMLELDVLGRIKEGAVESINVHKEVGQVGARLQAMRWCVAYSSVHVVAEPAPAVLHVVDICAT